MKTYSDLNLRLVAPDVWQPLVRQTLREIEHPGERQLTQSLIALLHSRHVGITPSYVAGCAHMLLMYSGDMRKRRTENVRPVESPWNEILEHLRQIARTPAGQSTSSRPSTLVQSERFGLLPHSAFRFVIFRIVGPLVREACYRHGESLLFSENTEGCDVFSPTSYTNYKDALKNALIDLISTDDNYMSVFWRDRAFSLQALTRGRDRTQFETIPDTSLPDSRLFLDLKPNLDAARNPQQRNIELSRDLRNFDPRWNDAGTDGTQYTRREEDYHRILNSEFIYPEVMRLDRLINTGYMILKPPPKPVQMRDVLVVGFCPGPVINQISNVFLKTCWFDFMMHFSLTLQHNGLVKSELRWIEGDDLDRHREQTLIVQNLPEILSELEQDQVGLRRFYFLKATNWFPAFLDGNAYYKPLPQTPNSRKTGVTKMRPYTKWIRQAWSAQRESLGWAATNDYRADDEVARMEQALFGDQSLQARSFAYIHIMLFLPAQEDKTPDQLSEAYRYWQAQFSQENSLSITWVPDHPKKAAWQYTGRRTHISALVRPEEENTLPAEDIAGRLVALWLGDLIKEIERA